MSGTLSVPAPARPALARAANAVARSAVRFCLLLQRAARQALRDHHTNLMRLAVLALLAQVIGTVYGRDPVRVEVPDALRTLDKDDVSTRVNVIAQVRLGIIHRPCLCPCPQPSP